MTTDEAVAASPARLLELGQAFADDVSTRIARAFPTDMRFSALTAADGNANRVSVAVFDKDVRRELSIPLTIAGKVRSRLFVKFDCWDTGSDYLAVDSSRFELRQPDRERDNPFFRYEYLREPTKDVPAAHLHVHAHRDEMVFALLTGEQKRPLDRQRADRPAHLAEVHFPLGGHRFRPCLEDVLEMIVLEFGVDTQPDWRMAVHEGREEWRRTQLRAAVRDAQSVAVEVLRTEGWEIAPRDVSPADRVDRLRAF